jgi:hypothetical protein
VRAASGSADVARPEVSGPQTNFICVLRLTPDLRSPIQENNFIFHVGLFYLPHLAGTPIAETQVNEEGSCNNHERCG